MAFGAVVELGSLDGVTGFRVTGETVSDYAGASLSAAGDVNGDGFEDFIVGAWLTNLNGPNTGATYLVFGKAGGFAPSLSLQTLNGANGFRIMETTPGADAFSVSGGGDYNGDGYDDILIGTRWDNASYRGGAYVVLGKNTAFAANVDPSGLNGTNGFRLVGAIDQGQAGRAVSNAGDVNGDGVDDFLVAAPYADNFNGVTYLVFGRESGFPASIQLSAIDGSNGFRLTGVESGKVSGFSASGGGDINGDGYDDLIIGSPNAFAPEFRMGATYVVYGKASFTAALSLGDLNGANGFTIGGEAARSNSAHSVANAGDVNGDGYDDMIIGAPYADPDGADSGAAYVVFGGPAGNAHRSLADLNGANGFKIIGEAAGDQSGFSVSGSGDFNGDGYADLIIGGPKADGGASDAGAAWVIFGKATGFNAVVDLAKLNGANGFEIRGQAASDFAGAAVSNGGDINGDGIDDLLVGAREFGYAQGAAYVIFGQLSAPINTLTGGGGIDRIAGTFGADKLLGLGGNDNLSGVFGDDLLDGGAGVDKLFGYDGDDTLLGGAGNDQIYGEVGDDVLNGGEGNDLLDGGTGADTMWGGDGNDVFLVDDQGDHTNEGLFEGYDIVRTALTWTLGDNVEQLELQGSGDVDGTGNIWGNKLYGNAGDNRLDGDLGVDTINGGDGDDVIIGGLDNDLLRGGTGADTFAVAHGFSVILETDQIYDFSTAEGDLIDLSGLDAIAGGDDDAFTLVSGFTKHAGEMTLTFAGGITILKLDITGDGKVDYQMKINGDVTGDSAGWLL